MDIGIKHTHVLIVSLYLLQLLVRIILMIAADKSKVEKYTKMMRVPHIVLSVIMLGTGIFLMVKAPLGMEPFVWVKVGLVAASIPLGVMGTKRGSIAFTILSFMLLAAAMGLAYAKPASLRSGGAAPTAGMSDAAKAGQALYETSCVLCHGNDGAAGFQGAKKLGETKMTDAEIMGIIKNGKGVMPANAQFSDTELENLKEYVRTLAK